MRPRLNRLRPPPANDCRRARPPRPASPPAPLNAGLTLHWIASAASPRWPTRRLRIPAPRAAPTRAPAAPARPPAARPPGAPCARSAIGPPAPPAAPRRPALSTAKTRHPRPQERAPRPSRGSRRAPPPLDRSQRRPPRSTETPQARRHPPLPICPQLPRPTLHVVRLPYERPPRGQTSSRCSPPNDRHSIPKTGRSLGARGDIHAAPYPRDFRHAALTSHPFGE